MITERKLDELEIEAELWLMDVLKEFEEQFMGERNNENRGIRNQVGRYPGRPVEGSTEPTPTES